MCSALSLHNVTMFSLLYHPKQQATKPDARLDPAFRAHKISRVAELTCMSIILIAIIMMLSTAAGGFKQQDIQDTPAQNNRVAKLAQEMIRIESITPTDAGGCQDVVCKRLQKIGFTCETMKFQDVTNLLAHQGDVSDRNKRLVVFAGHTDVVPPGPTGESVRLLLS